MFVINKFRYLTRDAESAIEVMREIEEAAGMKFTGIVNNSNLGDETTWKNVVDSQNYADKVSELTGLPIKMTCAKDSLCDILKDKVENLFPITLYVRQSWAKEN